MAAMAVIAEQYLNHAGAWGLHLFGNGEGGNHGQPG
jgi:hypothetical protein